MASLRAIKNHIIFQFEDALLHKTSCGKVNKQFSETTDWGFEVSDYDEGAKKPRWGIVTSLGGEVRDTGLCVGSRILVDALQWTEAANLGGVDYWRTDEDKILVVDETANG